MTERYRSPAMYDPCRAAFRNRHEELARAIRMSEERHPPTLKPLDGGGHVAYRFLPGRPPAAVFLCGYASETSGTRARFLHRVCAEAGHACLRFDYRGRGASSGRLEDGTIGSLGRLRND